MDTPVLLDGSGKPARDKDETCPGCGARCPRGDASKRRLSCGFGAPVDLCKTCGHDFGELTIPLTGNQ